MAMKGKNMKTRRRSLRVKKSALPTRKSKVTRKGKKVRRVKKVVKKGGMPLEYFGGKTGGLLEGGDVTTSYKLPDHLGAGFKVEPSCGGMKQC